ncbi:MAG: CHRD domain-containing protein [Actinomycetota bacterium]|nr:CHRD domain-containing protein [Actinomycetota bacterium]
MRASTILIGLTVALFSLSACSDEGGGFEVELSADNEVCDGDTCGGAGSGTATVEIDSDENEACYTFELEGMEGVNAAHIHEGEEGQSGDPVVDFAYEGDDGGGEGCVDGIDEEVLEDILDDPSGYYVNVHSEEYPDGAGRAQLDD